MGSQEGKDMYADWIVNRSRHLVHILEDMPDCKPAIDHLLELLPRLQPRFYSISSSSRVHKERIHVTAVVVEYETNTGRKNYGVCTKWLQQMVPKCDETPENAVGEQDAEFKVPCYVRRSQFRLPNRPQTPVIMVGPGTGLAPFRGFI